MICLGWVGVVQMLMFAPLMVAGVLKVNDGVLLLAVKLDANDNRAVRVRVVVLKSLKVLSNLWP